MEDSSDIRAVGPPARVPLWEELGCRGLPDLLWTIAETAWEQTRGPIYRARVLAAQVRAEVGPSWLSRDGADCARDAEGLARREQAVIVGFALHAAMQHAIRGQEAWLAAAMGYLGLAPLDADERTRLQGEIDALVEQLTALGQAERIVAGPEGEPG